MDKVKNEITSEEYGRSVCCNLEDSFMQEIEDDSLYIALKEAAELRADELDILTFGLEPFYEPLVTIVDENK